MDMVLQERLHEICDHMTDKANESGNFVCVCAHWHNGEVITAHAMHAFPVDDIPNVVKEATVKLIDEYRKGKMPATEPLPRSEALQYLMRKEAEIKEEAPEYGEN